MASSEPAYIASMQTGRLAEKVSEARKMLAECRLCPRRCGANRLAGEIGFCKTGENAVVCSFHAHFGEEASLVGANGSGTIFVTHCNLLCSFCQNYEISHGGEGQEVSAEQLAWMMLHLQREGCHNINFVTPSHIVPQLLAGVARAAEKGLQVPLVFNTGGYDRVETLKLLEGVVDIYMPDFKFWDSRLAEKTCDAPDYPEVVRRAVVEMHRQVGDLKMDENGIATRGLLVRHLVLPDGLAGTREVMDFLARQVSSETYVNIMPQYRPCGRARETKGLERPITDAEYDEALEAARKAGITRLDQRRRVFRLQW